METASKARLTSTNTRLSRTRQKNAGRWARRCCMKLIKILFALGLLAANSAHAQTCANPNGNWSPGADGSPDFIGSTCGQESGIVGVCGGKFHPQGPSYVLKFSPTSASTFTNISVSATAFNPVIYIFGVADSPCSTDAGNASCVVGGRTAIERSEIPVGQDYLIIVAPSDSDVAGVCGSFTLHTDGTFPVSLQSFQVD